MNKGKMGGLRKEIGAKTPLRILVASLQAIINDYGGDDMEKGM